MYISIGVHIQRERERERLTYTCYNCENPLTYEHCTYSEKKRCVVPENTHARCRCRPLLRARMRTHVPATSTTISPPPGCSGRKSVTSYTTPSMTSQQSSSVSCFRTSDIWYTTSSFAIPSLDLQPSPAFNQCSA